ncbi:6807_t:CDS:2 [Entrophospora sp. SA101]|nr:6807_t:CDS:2 [Entrophospora sp. SA101]
MGCGLLVADTNFNLMMFDINNNNGSVCCGNRKSVWNDRSRNNFYLFLFYKGKKKNILKHAPGWDETLASDSEAYVKADREPDPLSIPHLQNQTINDLIDKNKDGIDANSDDKNLHWKDITWK